jgi:hypothetical protein
MILKVLFWWFWLAGALAMWLGPRLHKSDERPL